MINKIIKVCILSFCVSTPALSDDSIDVVYCTVVFMHLDEWDRYEYVKEAFRVLKPGGRAYFDNFNLMSEEGWAIFESHHQISERPSHISKSSTPQELLKYFNFCSELLKLTE